MHDSILKFAEQLSFKPEIKNGPVDFQGLHAHAGKKIILGGMGGSALSPALFKLFVPEADIIVHRDYGLPLVPKDELAESLLVASSYSGNTEETLDFLESALRFGLRPAVIASGGKLLARAEGERLPHIKIPDTVIQPRVAVGFSLVAFSALIGRNDILEELARISSVLVPAVEEGEGKRIAEELAGCVPLIYSSGANGAIAYNWKIKINETAKVLAFANIFPELNHNEFAGFSENLRAPDTVLAGLFIHDENDHPRVQKRMQVTEELLADKKVKIVKSTLSGATPLERALRSLVTADWTAYHLALTYGENPDDIPAIEEFKKRILG